MSHDVLSKRLDVLKRKTVVKEADVAEALVAAERSVKGRSDGVSNVEARDVADFYVRTLTPGSSPKVPAPVLEGGAVNALNAFFIAHNLPYGRNKGPMKERIEQFLDNKPLGDPMGRAPRTGSLQPLRLTSNGDDRRDAYLDVVKKQFVLRVGDGSQAQFFGPFDLER